MEMMNDNLENSFESKKNKLWEESQKNEVIKRVKAGESFQDIMDSLENIKEAFVGLDTIVCSDGRVLSIEGTKIGIAGEGILLSKEELAKFIQIYKRKIKKVTSHDDCGAAGKAFAQEHPEKIKSSDELGINFAKWMAEQLDAEYEHIPMDKMKSDIHNERMICFDGTGKFNPASLKEMPGHFVCSGYGFGLSEKYMEEEIEILSGIALGHHGFGEKFNEGEKFYIVISAKDKEQLTKLTEIAQKGIIKIKDKVEIKGFVHDIEN